MTEKQINISIILAAVIVLALVAYIVVPAQREGRQEKTYCGKVVIKGYEAPTSGYKSSNPATYFVVMRVDSINKLIRVNVDVPTYYRFESGDRVCFTLSRFRLTEYGNGDHHLIK